MSNVRIFKKNSSLKLMQQIVSESLAPKILNAETLKKISPIWFDLSTCNCHTILADIFVK